MDRLWLGLLISVAVPACYLPEHDAPCPCSEGWTCCPGAQVCAQSSDLCPGGGAPDASSKDPEWVVGSHGGYRQIQPEQPVAGVDSDRAGGLWIAYYVEG